ncbi:MAG: ABC transporter substrate-binding protein, partial [Xanthobacteraceae bacterium]
MKTIARLILALPFSLLAVAAQAEIKVGFVTSLSGPAASIGIPYSKGMAAAVEYANSVNGEKINLIQLDDGSDPSTATRNARKLVEEDKVDVLIGTASAPSTIAMVAVANELKVPMIAISPISVPKVDDLWAIDVVQPTDLMSIVVADRMARLGQKNVGYIGFSDAWGDLVYKGAKAAEADGKIKLLTDQRYGRTDTSVTGQILTLLA